MDINNVTLTGRLGGDLELRSTATGTSVANVNLAVECGFGDRKKTAWIGLDFWGKSAESASKFLGKGRKVAVSGRLEQSEYEDKNGNKVTKTRVVVENWTFADSEKSGNRDEGSVAPPRREAAPQSTLETTAPMSGGGRSDDDDDIPF